METKIHKVALADGGTVAAVRRIPSVVWFLAAALTIRLMGLGAAALWFDEAVTKFRATLPLSLYFKDYTDFIGPNLWDLLVRPFGYGPVWLLRVPALLAAMTGVWLGWRLSISLGLTRAEHITASALVCILPGLIWQAQDARYYAAVGTLYVAAIAFGVAARPLGLLGCIVVLPYVHPVGAFYAAAALVIGWISGLGGKRVIALGAAATVAYLPRIYSLLMPGPGRPAIWTHEMTPLFVLDQTAQALTVGTLGPAAALMLVLVFALSAGAAFWRLREHRTRILLAAALLPIVIMLGVSSVLPVYFYRPVQPALIVICMLVALSLAPGPGLARKIALATTTLLLFSALLYWDPVARGGYIDKGAAVIAREWHDGDRIVYASPTVALPFAYYLQDKIGCLIPHNDMGDLPAGLKNVSYCVDDYTNSRTWLVWPRDPTLNPELTRQLGGSATGLLPVWRSDFAWQFSPIEVYYLP